MLFPKLSIAQIAETFRHDLNKVVLLTATFAAVLLSTGCASAPSETSDPVAQRLRNEKMEDYINRKDRTFSSAERGREGL